MSCKTLIISLDNEVIWRWYLKLVESEVFWFDDSFGLFFEEDLLDQSWVEDWMMKPLSLVVVSV